MTTLEPLTDPQEMADMEEVSRLLARGQRITDTELLHRLHARADAVRDAAFRKFGVQDIGMGIIRERRDAVRGE